MNAPEKKSIFTLNVLTRSILEINSNIDYWNNLTVFTDED